MRANWKRYFIAFLWATGCALGVRLFLLEDYRIFSDSMAPNLLAGDLIFVTKASYNVRMPFSTYELLRWSRPRRGEVVAFALPDFGWETYIKRVVALEGDEVSIRGGELYVNGKAASYTPGEGASHLRWETLDGAQPYPIVWETGKIPDYGPVQVPAGYFFVLGDNRINSVDSRTWGPVPYPCLKGKVRFIWLSTGPQGLRSERIGTWIRS